MLRSKFVVSVNYSLQSFDYPVCMATWQGALAKGNE